MNGRDRRTVLAALCIGLAACESQADRATPEAPRAEASVSDAEPVVAPATQAPDPPPSDTHSKASPARPRVAPVAKAPVAKGPTAPRPDDHSSSPSPVPTQRPTVKRYRVKRSLDPDDVVPVEDVTAADDSATDTGAESGPTSARNKGNRSGRDD